MKWLARHLFSIGRPDSLGQAIYFKLIEVYVLYYVITWAWKWGRYMQSIEGVVHPLGIANHIDVTFMYGSNVSLWNAAFLSLMVLLGFFRVAPRVTWSLAMLSFHLHYASRYVLGEICHSSNFVGMSVLAFAAAAWVTHDPLMRRRTALGLMYFYLGLAYFLGGMSKLVASGGNWAHGSHLWLWISEKSVDFFSKFGYYEMNWIQELAVNHLVIATLLLAGGLIVELLGVLLWFRVTRPYAALAAIGLHLGIHFAMNILFDMFIYQLLLIGFHWDDLLDRWAKRWSPRTRERVHALAMRFA